MSTPTATISPDILDIPFVARGAVADLFTCEAPEVVIHGPAGPGKTRGVLEYLHYRLSTTPLMKALMARKTLQSLKTSAIKTYEEKVNPFLDGVVFKNETRRDAAHYFYPQTGARLYIGGLDNPIKIMSTEYDIIYIPEATEVNESDWDACTMRLRNGRLHFQQLIGDCNPDAPTHWLRLRMDAHRTHELVSVYEDNPMLWDKARNDWTPEGKAYVARLDNLTGVRYLRYRKGQWAAAEGMVYADSWNRAENLIDRFPIPADWPRFLSIDFGYTHPFVCQWWAEDPDGRLYRYREIYATRRLVEDHARDIKLLSHWWSVDGEPVPRAIICDHDAEDRATLEKHLGLMTIPAHKSVSDGIQAVAARWRPAGDGKPRLYYLRESLVARDSYLTDAKQPTCSEEEIESYVWGMRKEAPVKELDHGMDCTRYAVAHRDLRPNALTQGPRLY